ncbi:MAG: sigma-54 factor interaction domain-containing protein [Gemmatimonadota bacterium]
MMKAMLVVLFLAIPDFVCDCLDCTGPHLPPSTRVTCTRSRRIGSFDEPAFPRPEHDSGARCRCCGLLGRSPPIMEVLDLCDRVAATEATVLITGETGTGKDLLARCIHLHSRRTGHRFTPVACAALPESLIESQLFGHKRGSFTGAVTDQRGLIDHARGGTLVLDEIDALSLAMQAKLLRVVEEHRIQRIGGDHDTPVDFRLIAATNADLEELVAEGAFRPDLFYRLNVVRIEIPPLRDRTEDIPELARSFRDAFARESGLPVVPFADRRLKSRSNWNI